MTLSEAKPILESLVLVAAAVGGVAALWKLVWLPIIKTSLRTKAFFKRLCEGLDKINVIDTRVRDLEGQFRVNGGGSIKDDLISIKERLGYIENLASAQMEEDPSGVFIADSNGFNSYVNRTYCRMLGCVKEQLMGRGWESFISHSVGDKYDSLWKDAFLSNREVATDLYLQKSDETHLCVHLQIVPLNRASDKTRRFLGRVKINRDCSREKCLVSDSCPIADRMPHRP